MSTRMDMNADGIMEDYNLTNNDLYPNAGDCGQIFGLPPYSII